VNIKVGFPKYIIKETHPLRKTVTMGIYIGENTKSKKNLPHRMAIYFSARLKNKADQSGL